MIDLNIERTSFEKTSPEKVSSIMPIDLNSKRTLSDRINTIIDAVPFNEEPRKYLGCSTLGGECERAVQYEAIRAFYPESRKEISNDFPPRVRRIFKRGFLFEDEAIKWFQNAGFHLITRDYRKLPQEPTQVGARKGIAVAKQSVAYGYREQSVVKPRSGSEEFSTQNSNDSEYATGRGIECYSIEGEQLGTSWFDGQLQGHLDGIFVFYKGNESRENAKESNGKQYTPFELPALWEHKCVNDKNFKLVIKDKLKKAFPKYYAQMQMYMNGYNLSQGLITFTNANTMELHHELIMYDDAIFTRLLGRAERVINATHRGEILPRHGGSGQSSAHFICKFCNYTKVCWA